MNFKFLTVLVLSLITCTQAVTSYDECELLENLVGQELLALDDAYAIRIEDTSDDAEKTIYLLYQGYLQKICRELLRYSTMHEAQYYLFEFARRYNDKQPMIDYALQVNNDFVGDELELLDYVLEQACLEVLNDEDSNVYALIHIFALRCSVLGKSIRLLHASEHEEAPYYHAELLERLKACTITLNNLIEYVESPETTEETID